MLTNNGYSTIVEFDQTAISLDWQHYMLSNH
jgi:hypothetical protein